jgi:hypothetical protein
MISIVCERRLGYTYKHKIQMLLSFLICQILSTQNLFQKAFSPQLALNFHQQMELVQLLPKH